MPSRCASPCWKKSTNGSPRSQARGAPRRFALLAAVALLAPILVGAVVRRVGHGMVAQGPTVSIDEVRAGAGPAGRIGDRVAVRYRLLDSVERPRDTATFKAGSNEAIAGLSRGVLGMQAGGVRVLGVPPALGFRDLGISTPTYEDAFSYEVELIEIVPP